MSLYVCKACDYTTISKAAYNKHLKTKKHLKNTGQGENEEIKGNVLNIDLNVSETAPEINQDNINSFFNQSEGSESLEDTEAYEDYMADSEEDKTQVDDEENQEEDEIEEPEATEEVNIKVNKQQPDNNEIYTARIEELEHIVSELEQKIETKSRNEKRLEEKLNETTKLMNEKFKKIQLILQTLGSKVDRVEDKVDDNVDFIAGQTSFNQKVLMIFKGLT